MTVFRFAIFAAVSKPEQVKDKDSLKKQIELSMEAGLRLGGKHIETYVIDGHSRTRFYDLTRAAKVMPDLQRCLNELQRWDVLICRNFDRYRDIGDMMYNKLAHENGKQMYSVEQATTLYPPDQYDPYKDTATPMMLKMVGMGNVYAISKIVSNFDTGIPARAEAGMYPIRPPRGYIDNSIRDRRRLVEYKLELDPLVSGVLIKIKDMYLRGASTIQCAEYARTHGVYMVPNGVLYALEHPFYCGRIVLDATIKDRTTGERIPNPNAKVFEGNHPKLWTYAEHMELVLEIKRRSRVVQRRRTFPLSGLMSCGICGNTLLSQQSNMSRKFIYYRCRTKGHVAIRQDTAHRLFADEINRMFKNFPELPDEPPKATVDNQLAIEAIEKQIDRINTAYETAAYSLEEFTKRKQKLNTKIKELKDEQIQYELTRHDHSRAQQVRRKIKDILPEFYRFITEEPPNEINVLLSEVCQKIVVFKDKRMEITLRN